MTAGLSPTMADAARIMEVNLVGVARLLAAFDARVGEGTAAAVFASMAAHIGFELPAEVLAVLDDPLAPDLAGRLQAVGFELSDPGLAYMLSKLGVVRLARRTAGEWWKRGARIVSVSPGIIHTPMGDQELEQQPMMAGTIATVGRMGTADEVAAVACFLVSDEASFVSGIDVLVDGAAGVIAAEREGRCRGQDVKRAPQRSAAAATMESAPRGRSPPTPRRTAVAYCSW